MPDERGQQRADHALSAEVVQVHLLLQVGLGAPQKLSLQAVPGVIDEHIQRSLGEHFAHTALYAVAVGHVEHDGLGVPAVAVNLLGNSVQGVGVSSGQDQRVALPGQSQRGGAPNALGSAGDENASGGGEEVHAEEVVRSAGASLLPPRQTLLPGCCLLSGSNPEPHFHVRHASLRLVRHVVFQWLEVFGRDTAGSKPAGIDAAVGRAHPCYRPRIAEDRVAARLEPTGEQRCRQASARRARDAGMVTATIRRRQVGAIERDAPGVHLAVTEPELPDARNQLAPRLLQRRQIVTFGAGETREVEPWAVLEAHARLPVTGFGSPGLLVLFVSDAVQIFGAKALAVACEHLADGGGYLASGAAHVRRTAAKESAERLREVGARRVTAGQGNAGDGRIRFVCQPQRSRLQALAGHKLSDRLRQGVVKHALEVKFAHARRARDVGHRQRLLQALGDEGERAFDLRAQARHTSSIRGATGNFERD